MNIILGIDPGSRITGYGVVAEEANKLTYIASGCIRTEYDSIPERIAQIFAGVSQIISQYKPTVASIEEVFMSVNPGAALKLGQARGAAIAAIVKETIPVYEYSAREVKKAMVGTGAADKTQVKHMVKTLLKLSGDPQADAADALAIAICHINTYRGQQQFKKTRNDLGK